MRSTRLGFFQTSSYDWDGILCNLSMMNSGLPCSQILLAILFDATTFGWCGTCCDIINGLVKMEHIGPNSRKGRHLSMFWASHVNLRWGPWVLWIWWLPKRKKRILKYIKLVANTNNHLAFIPPLYDFQRNYCNRSHTLYTQKFAMWKISRFMKRKVREVAWTKFTSSTQQVSNKPEFHITVFFLFALLHLSHFTKMTNESI